MANVATRFMLTVPVDMAEKAEALKKNLFYDKPYAEMYRQLIQARQSHLKAITFQTTTRRFAAFGSALKASAEKKKPTIQDGNLTADTSK